MKLSLKTLVTIPTFVVCTAMFADWNRSSINRPLTDLSSIDLPTDANDQCKLTDEVFDGWFEKGKRSPNGVVKPANSVTFPNIPNCSFYQWTEQMFLWLTSPAPARYGGGKHIFDSPAFYDVSPPDEKGIRTFIPHKPGMLRTFNLRAAQLGPNRLPVVVDKQTHKLFEVVTPPVSARGRMLMLNAVGKQVEVQRLQINTSRTLTAVDLKGQPAQSIKPIINVRLRGKAILQKVIINGRPFFLDGAGKTVEVETGQAGGGEALQAQNGSMVYYSTIVNQVYAYQRTMLGNAAIPSTTRFPTTQSELDAIVNFASAKGKKITDPEALAIEIKTSWIETTNLTNKDQFITVTATIPTYDKSNPTHWVVNGQKTAELAMVGMHIVGSTKGHPEMLWGTFEHVSNAPDTAYSYINANKATVKVPFQTAGTWLFASNGAKNPFNQAHMRDSSRHIVSLIGDDKKKFLISPSNTIRRKAWGMESTSANSNTEVISMNNNVRSKLLEGDVRRHYVQTGTTWTIGGQQPSSSNQVGTSLLANTTMETYQQGTNCFSCHFSNKVDVSHVFEATKPLF